MKINKVPGWNNLLGWNIFYKSIKFLDEINFLGYCLTRIYLLTYLLRFTIQSRWHFIYFFHLFLLWKKTVNPLFSSKSSWIKIIIWLYNKRGGTNKLPGWKYFGKSIERGYLIRPSWVEYFFKNIRAPGSTIRVQQSTHTLWIFQHPKSWILGPITILFEKVLL